MSEDYKIAYYFADQMIKDKGDKNLQEAICGRTEEDIYTVRDRLADAYISGFQAKQPTLKDKSAEICKRLEGLIDEKNGFYYHIRHSNNKIRLAIDIVKDVLNER